MVYRPHCQHLQPPQKPDFQGSETNTNQIQMFLKTTLTRARISRPNSRRSRILPSIVSGSPPKSRMVLIRCLFRPHQSPPHRTHVRLPITGSHVLSQRLKSRFLRCLFVHTSLLLTKRTSGCQSLAAMSYHRGSNPDSHLSVRIGFRCTSSQRRDSPHSFINPLSSRARDPIARKNSRQHSIRTLEWPELEYPLRKRCPLLQTF
ncbi:hypothetical protein B0H19DRAFT_1161778 [Mycena capillaripes]|nr:hypothetical protein B0H19DRAFT_1161778 [Mycena capillaripes]